MKVIGISGSPRKDGNTEILVREALKPFYEKGWKVTEFLPGDILKQENRLRQARILGENIIKYSEMVI